MEANKQLENLLKRVKKKLSIHISIQMKAKKSYLILEKRCHYHSTTNVKGDSHESAYMEGQRSVFYLLNQCYERKGK